MDHPHIKLVMGIGNPSEEFRDTYHNVGIIALDNFARAFGDGNFRLVSQGSRNEMQRAFLYLRTPHLILVKSTAFMNNSGESVRNALKYFGVAPGELLLAHDESDIRLGECRFSFNRGAAGHRGVASVIAALGTKAFWRFRIGIYRAAEEHSSQGSICRAREKAANFVLKKIRPSELDTLNALLHKAATTISPRGEGVKALSLKVERETD